MKEEGERKKVKMANIAGINAVGRRKKKRKEKEKKGQEKERKEERKRSKD